MRAVCLAFFRSCFSALLDVMGSFLREDNLHAIRHDIIDKLAPERINMAI